MSETRDLIPFSRAGNTRLMFTSVSLVLKGGCCTHSRFVPQLRNLQLRKPSTLWRGCWHIYPIFSLEKYVIFIVLVKKKNLPSVLEGDIISVFQRCVLYKRSWTKLNVTWQDFPKCKTLEQLSPNRINLPCMWGWLAVLREILDLIRNLEIKLPVFVWQGYVSK